MEVNFFGLTQVTKKAMEVMREQKPSGGLIQQVTSVGGQIGVPLFSFYCASKWAVEGFTETLVSYHHLILTSCNLPTVHRAKRLSLSGVSNSLASSQEDSGMSISHVLKFPLQPVAEKTCVEPTGLDAPWHSPRSVIQLTIISTPRRLQMIGTGPSLEIQRRVQRLCISLQLLTTHHCVCV